MSIHTTKNSTVSKLDNFKTWLEGKPYWDKYLWQLHISKGILDEEDINKCYHFLLEDCDALQKTLDRPDIIFSQLNLDDAADIIEEKITLDKVTKLQDVNALDKSCEIEFGKNLTIIYGDNGSGKSGIGRLLSNACFSRQPRKLLPNIKESLPNSVTKADFHISNLSGSSVINYELGQIYQELKYFSVFDHECALIHLDGENEVEFIPSKIKIFDDVFGSITKIEEIFNLDISSKKQDNPVERLFYDSSDISIFLNSLSHNTTEKEIQENIEFTESDKKLLEQKSAELSEKIKLDISKQKNELAEEYSDLNSYRSVLVSKTKFVNQDKVNAINGLIEEIKSKKEIVNKLSINNFDFTYFKNVGSPEWKALIFAAQKLYEKELESNSGAKLSHCLLCRQKLTSEEETLFNNYWEFLKSTAENELAQARQKLEALIYELDREISYWPEFSDAEIAIKILKRDIPDDLGKIKDDFLYLKNEINSLIEKASKEISIDCIEQIIDLKLLDELIDKKIKIKDSLIDPTYEINSIKDDILILEQKQQVSRIIEQIKNYISWLKWKNAVGIINLASVKGLLTRKRTEIISELVVSKYIDIFNGETEALNCNFGLEIGSRGRESTTVTSLKLNFARGHNPSDILSEGEQTVSAIADFITEAKLDKNNSGIIFDDPVTSLDHERKSIIARHLVKEAKNRQVIILTHDLSFLLDLQYYSELESVDRVLWSIMKNGDRVGVTKKELPWLALNVKSRVGYLKQDLVRIKVIENGDSDLYRREIKGWYGLLRETWERAVEERLFKGVVLRFSKSVQTQKLKSVVITEDLKKEVEEGMSESSKWLHDMAIGINPMVPKNDKLINELKLLDDFITKCLP